MDTPLLAYAFRTENERILAEPKRFVEAQIAIGAPKVSAEMLRMAAQVAMAQSQSGG